MEEAGKKSQGKGLFSDDFFVGAVIILFSVSIFVHIPGSFGDAMLFPMIVGIVSLVCGLMIAVFSFLRPAGTRYAGFDTEATASWITAIMFAVMLFNDFLGFYTCLFLVCFEINALIAYFCGKRGVESILRSLALSAMMCGLIFVIFNILLGILTPRGLFV